MTQKELLYLEDAIEHEKNIITICKESLNNLEDEKLISFLEKQLEKHNETKEKILSMLEVKSNG